MSSHRRPEIDVSTSCACGAVSVAVHGGVRAMFLCSCEDCQRATGSGHAAAAMVDGDAVTVTGQTRSFSRPAASGAEFVRHFCPACGTPIFAATTRAPESLLLPVGLFGAQSDWFRPNQLIFSRSHRAWDSVAADLPRHATYRDEETPRMSEASDELADRLRACIGHRPGITEQRMFGGVCFMHYGNMLVGAMKSGALLARVGPERYQEAQSRPGAAAMEMGGRRMSGFLEVTDEGIDNDEALRDWIAYSEAFVHTLPPK